MEKKKILGFIPVSDKTYERWQFTKLRIKSKAGPAAIGATFGAIWCGYVMSIINSNQIGKLRKDHEDLQEQVNHNASCSIFDRHRIEDLERQNNLLMEKALTATEGKKDEADQ